METANINSFFNIDERLLKLNGQITEKCGERFKEIESVTEFNQLKVLSAFIKNGVSEAAMAACAMPAVEVPISASASGYSSRTLSAIACSTIFLDSGALSIRRLSQ